MKTINRVLLINPARNYIPNSERKVCTQPLGLAYVAGAVRDAGYEVKIIDATVEGYENESPARNGFIRYGLSVDDIEEKIRTYAPHVVGVGCIQSLQLYEAYEVFEIIRKINAKIITVFGGAHASAMYTKEIQNPAIDYIVVGEGELSFVNLLDCLNNRISNNRALPGVAYLKNSKIIFTPGPRIKNLDLLPKPAWDLLPMDLYNKQGASASSYGNGNIAILQTSRGCPHHCLHCPKNVVFGETYRVRSIPKVIEDIQYLHDAFGIQEICLEDSNFTIHKKRVMDFCRAMQGSHAHIRFSLPHGIEVQTLDEEMLKAMWSAGFYALHLSIESANEIVKRTQDKRLNSDRMMDIIAMAKTIGYKITGYFMVGFPEETLEDVQMTIDYAEKLHLDKVNFFIFHRCPEHRFLTNA